MRMMAQAPMGGRGRILSVPPGKKEVKMATMPLGQMQSKHDPVT